MHEFRVRVRLVSTLSATVLKDVRLFLTGGLQTLARTCRDGVGLGAILRRCGLGEEGSPWLPKLASRVPVVVELESSAMSVIGDSWAPASTETLTRLAP